MTRTRCLKLAAASTLAAIFSFHLAGCGDSGSSGSSRNRGGDDNDAGGGTGNVVGTGGVPFVGTGGASPITTGGTSGTGTGGAGATNAGADAGGAGGAGGTVASDAGQCATANEPIIDPALFPVCDQCPAARCVPSAAVPEDVRNQLADCVDDPTAKCVPDTFVATGGNLLLQTCESLDGAEGRCVPSCLPAVESMAAYLPVDVCAVNEVCAPCYNPLDGVETGACGVSCDPGATEPAVTFEKCCGGIGSCVPAALVPTDLQSSLGADTCADSTRLCAPDQFVDSSNQPATCVSVAGTEGRCIPDCVPAVESRATFLPKDVCAEGELCAPCFDPTTGLPTGSCTINGDSPTNPDPYVFPDCCGSLGVCVPTSVVPVEQQGLLSADTCTGDGELCAPRDLTDSTFVPTTCDSIAGAEGRCLPACLPDIAAQADRLPQAICEDGYLCAPCYDPLTGELTGACDLNGDSPKEPPFVFGTCCGGLGSCVPTSLVPVDQQSLLDADTCTGQDVLCAPDKLTDTTYVPPTCTSIGGFEGRCLAACLPDIEAQASRLPQDICETGELCAPCYDPMTGEATGACDLNGDEPVDPPGTFDKCCGGLGTCVPTSAVPPEQQSMLDANTCTDAGYLCAPTSLADTSYKPPACDSISGFEGRCLPACLPDIAAQADRLPQATCGTGELCAPCYDPITGEATGACTINGDAPAEPKQTFDACCGGIGVCVPETLVPAEQQTLLGTDTCTDANTLCAPTALTDPTVKPAVCYSFGTQQREGRCIAACVPQVQERASQLQQETCADGELCAPCYDPVVGGSTGACEINGDAPIDPDPGTFVECEATNSLVTLGCLLPPAVPPVAGRCVPDYIALASSGGDLLCRVTCANGELCAPCISPLDNTPTGACP